MSGPARHSAGADLCGSRPLVVYDLPLNEVVFDFYDRLKSVTKATPASTTRSPATGRTTS
ncbi:translation elongation factor LepA [Limimaricola cinnabarinus LL-001]|uniref:Translation elongation factor LepA n=1 Tax=Limimaricola cinnabarinus LL-001 TaxID=1337093 RepID=U2YI63_9RHOB|nr:translation elongation factor LepA [Limimaricola cinnabarinus LL-001]